MKTYVYQDHIKIQKKLENYIFDWKDKSVMDLGCNVGLLGVYLQSRGISDYVGIDWEEEVIRIGQERYPALELISGDVEQILDREVDVTIAMALFHHFSEDKLRRVLGKLKSNELIFEVPVGSNSDFQKYNLRTQKWYIDLIKEVYGEVVRVEDSGATNDPWNTRVIFTCKKND